MEYDRTFKIITLGDSGVGKTSLLVRFVDHYYIDKDRCTVSPVDFKFSKLKVGGKNVRLKICDTVGDERFRAVAKQYYRGANGIILVYDTTNLESFNNLPAWFNYISEWSEASAKVLLVGTKLDDSSKRCVPRDDVENYAKSIGVEFIETSAKIDLSVEFVFNEMVKMLLEANADDETIVQSTIRLKNDIPEANVVRPNSKKKCC